jgi:phage terminase large subunit
MAVLTVTPNYKPHAKQILLHNAPMSFEDISITLFGGARGAGKSSGIMADAFMFAVSYPGAKCGIFRENLSAVKQSFLDKLPTLFPETVDGVKIYEYREKSSSWYPSRSVIFSNGSYITFQRCADYREALGFRGWEFHYLAIDECTLVEEKALDFLLTCVRSAVVPNKATGKPYKIPTKVVYGCNPGGISHRYVKEKYIDTTVTKYDKETRAPLETRDYIEIVKHPEIEDLMIKKNIRFIPASYKDNPYLSPAYVANLMAQPEHIKARDMYGNWDIVAGRMFDLKDDRIISAYEARKLITDEKAKADIYISIDWGYNPSYHSAHWYAVLRDQRIVCFKEMYGQDLVFEDFVAEIVKRSGDLFISGTMLPHDMFRRGEKYRDDKGRIIGETKADVFESAGLNPLSIESGKGKVQLRYDKTHSALASVNPDGVPKLMISRECENLIRELQDAVYDELDYERIAKSCADHAIDDLGLFLIFYSDDICPLGHDIIIADNRSKLQQMLDEEEEYLDSIAEEEELCIANGFDLW